MYVQMAKYVYADINSLKKGCTIDPKKKDVQIA